MNRFPASEATGRPKRVVETDDHGASDMPRRPGTWQAAMKELTFFATDRTLAPSNRKQKATAWSPCPSSSVISEATIYPPSPCPSTLPEDISAMAAGKPEPTQGPAEITKSRSQAGAMVKFFGHELRYSRKLVAISKRRRFHINGNYFFFFFCFPLPHPVN